MGNKLTNIEFIERARNIHGEKYDYSLVEYIGSKTKIKIICPIHGEFLQLPYSHYNGFGCSKCTNKYSDNKNFIEKAKLIHNNKYDYSLVDYKNSKFNVKIICPIHGIFEQRPNDHLNKRKCPKCSNKYKPTTEEFIINAKKIHENKYDYSLVNYLCNRKKIKIICPIHGIFEQTPNDHLHGIGCSVCKQSKGENKVEKFLLSNNLNFIREKTFDNCKYKQKLQFDFYLPERNICIEYDGKQHFESIEHFGGKIAFKTLQERDKIKNDFCVINNINLIRIRYDQNIENNLKLLI